MRGQGSSQAKEVCGVRELFAGSTQHMLRVSSRHTSFAEAA